VHVLPKGFHRIRHYGLFARGNRVANLARARKLLAASPRATKPESNAPSEPDQSRTLPKPCPCCGGRMFIIEVFTAGCDPKHRPTPVIRIDTS
jgi:hypothetical protein